MFWRHLTCFDVYESDLNEFIWKTIPIISNYLSHILLLMQSMIGPVISESMSRALGFVLQTEITIARFMIHIGRGRGMESNGTF